MLPNFLWQTFDMAIFFTAGRSPTPRIGVPGLRSAPIHPFSDIFRMAEPRRRRNVRIYYGELQSDLAISTFVSAMLARSRQPRARFPLLQPARSGAFVSNRAENGRHSLFDIFGFSRNQFVCKSLFCKCIDCNLRHIQICLI